MAQHDPPRYRISLEDLSRRLDGGIRDIIEIWRTYDAFLVRWADRNNMPVAVREVLAPGVTCPDHKTPLVWDKYFRRLVCPERGCGWYMADDHSADPVILAVLGDQKREAKMALRGKPKNRPIRIVKREGGAKGWAKPKP